MLSKTNIVVGAFSTDKLQHLGMLIRDRYPLLSDHPFAALITGIDQADHGSNPASCQPT